MSDREIETVKTRVDEPEDPAPAIPTEVIPGNTACQPSVVEGQDFTSDEEE